MMGNQDPLVTVLTPVYNMGDYLSDCIESVLAQAYHNYEYIIVNNCSTDKTFEVASKYAKMDSRIRVHNNSRFVPVMENHNIACRLMSPEAKYCKVVCADDFLFAECLARMVELAEANPSVGVVGCYQLSGDHILWQGFEFPKSVIPGREMGRRIFLRRNPHFGFGSPTSTMYRSDLVRERNEFYPNPSPHSDTSACFAILQKADFGFVFQVLAYERTHVETQSSASAAIDRYSSAYLSDLITYGPYYLTSEELRECVNEAVKGYLRSLGVSYMLGGRGRDYWQYHETRMRELGFPLTKAQLFKAAAGVVLREVWNPQEAYGKLRRRMFPRSLN